EWRYYESIQWFLTEEYETHRHHQAFIKALNHLYTAEPALYERGYTDDGFTWIDADNSKQSIVSFVRQGEDVDDDLVILINFDPASYESFRVGVPREGDWEVIFDSDRPEFGGSGYAGEEPYTCSSEPYPWNGQMDSIKIKVPGLAGVVLKRRGPSSYKPPVVEEPKKATRKRMSTVKPKAAAAKKAPAKAKATTTKTKAKTKATATKKPAAKKSATKAKSASVKPSAKDA
ncbi:MAG: alpha amylase C-terminal domain-containing protein, partial [Collinsella sp.]|nr:alpha amylase C-terminal domain-containing protein [Collinsella sp.]